jgi:phage FluMu protein Com
MRIITYRCPNCGTVVAANELEANRVMKCPRNGCQEVLRFEDLTEEEQEFFVDNRNRYQI